MSINISYKKQFLFFLLSAIILLAAVEGSARFYEFFVQDCNLDTAETLNHLDFFLKREICSDQQNVIYSYSPVDTIEPNQHFKTININNEGFRGPEINYNKTNNDFRIFMIGGSTVFGSGLSNDRETIPYQLFKKFNEKYDNVEVINAGISSITSFEELYIIENILVNLKPDMIIVYDGVNDIGYKRINEPEIQTSSDDISLKNFQKYLRSPVVLYRYILLPMYNYEFTDSPDRTNQDSRFDEETSKIISSLWGERMNEFCKISNKYEFESVVIIQPALYYGNKPLSDYEKSILIPNTFWTKTFEKMINESKTFNNCSLTLNFSNIFENTSQGVYIDQVHINPYGHKIIAEEIYQKILPLVIKNL